MKNLLVILTVLFLGSVVIYANNKQVPQQPKLYKFEFNEAEVNTIYTALDNAAISGEIRKPILQKIALQFQQQSIPDTSHKKK